MRNKIGLGNFRAVYAVDGDGDGGGSAGTVFTEEQVRELVSNQTAALKAKNDELLGKMRDVTGKLKNWDGLDPQKVRGMLDSLEKNEDLKLIAEGRHEEVIHRRLEREQATWKSQLEERDNELNQLRGSLKDRENQVRDLMIDTSVLNAFLAEGGLPSAKDDVVLRATVFFDVENGEVVARDIDGELVRGKDGPITIKEWVASLKQNAPHLFPGSVGAGAGGGAGGRGADVESRMAAAAASGDMKEYRRLRVESRKK